MAEIQGTNIVAPVVPLDTTDVHPTHDAVYGKGGYRVVSSNADRDAIPSPRRDAGMLVFVTATSKTWRLSSDLSSWTEELGGVGPTGPSGAASSVPGPTGPTGSASAVTGPTGAVGAASTVTGPTGPAGTTTWEGITDKPSLVNTVAGRSGDVTLTQNDIPSQLGGVDIEDDIDYLYQQLIAHGHNSSQVLTFSNNYPLTAIDAFVDDSANVGVGNAVAIALNTDQVVFAGARLPLATTSVRGAVIVGTGLGVSSGTVSVSYGTSGTTACAGNDSRLSDSRTPTSHAHGNITNAGAIGSTANQIVVTGASGVLTTATIGSGLTLSGGTLTASGGGGGGSSVGSDLYLWATYR